MLVLLMLLSQRLDPSRNEPYILIKMCKCVIFLWRVDELLSLIYLSSLFSLDVDNLYHYFFTCIVGMWHTFFGYASFYLFERILITRCRSLEVG